MMHFRVFFLDNPSRHFLQTSFFWVPRKNPLPCLDPAPPLRLSLLHRLRSIIVSSLVTFKRQSLILHAALFFVFVLFPGMAVSRFPPPMDPLSFKPDSGSRPPLLLYLSPCAITPRPACSTFFLLEGSWSPFPESIRSLSPMHVVNFVACSLLKTFFSPSFFFVPFR